MPLLTTFTTCLTALFLFSPAHAVTIGLREVNSASKAGLAWPNGNNNDMSQYRSTGKVSWYYTWSPWPTDATDIEFVPMLWGMTQIDQYTSTINNTISTKQVTAVLAFNEPQQSGQSNLSPEDGASLWKQYIEPLKARGLRLGSPAPSSAPSGKTWLQDFLTACNGGCTVDFIALHWYATNATDFKQYLTDFHDTFDRPLWVTEWACQNYSGGKQCTDDGVPVFLNETQSFMDSTDWVERYAYFGVMENMQGVNDANRMMDKDGKITDLGRQYIGETDGGDGVTVNNAALPMLGTRNLVTLVAATLSVTLMFP